jgi:hypothetical protein
MKLIFLIALILPALPALASIGDEQAEYQSCVSSCTSLGCSKPSLDLKIFRWSCPDRCRYDCMQSDVRKRLERGETLVQYHGKWPFKRWMGMQEPASVVFSVLNGLAHVAGLKRMQSLPSHPMLPLYKAYAWINVNTWIWSTIFHCRDVYWTERMDYWSAALGIWFAAFQAVVKAFALFSTPWMLPWTTITSISYVVHVVYLARLTRFDYGYNMLACTTVGILANLVWMLWCMQNRRRKYPLYMMGLVIGISLAMSLELLDFPPLMDLVDAHSLWHACTVPLIFLLYEFVVRDVVWENSAVEKTKAKAI